MITKQPRKRIKEYERKNREFSLFKKKDDVPVKVLSASKRSSIAEYLVNKLTCANGYNLNRFKIIKNCSNGFDLTKMKVIYTLFWKLILCE